MVDYDCVGGYTWFDDDDKEQNDQHMLKQSFLKSIDHLIISSSHHSSWVDFFIFPPQQDSRN